MRLIMVPTRHNNHDHSRHGVSVFVCFFPLLRFIVLFTQIRLYIYAYSVFVDVVAQRLSLRFHRHNTHTTPPPRYAFCNDSLSPATTTAHRNRIYYGDDQIAYNNNNNNVTQTDAIQSRIREPVFVCVCLL